MGYWFICKALMTSIWLTWKKSNMWWHLGPNGGWQNGKTDNGCNLCRVKVLWVDFVWCGGVGWGGVGKGCEWLHGLEPAGHFILSSCCDLTERWRRFNRIAAWLICIGLAFLYFFNLTPFLCFLTNSLASQFLEKSVKGLAKSPLRQRSHSWMQASGLAPSN